MVAKMIAIEGLDGSGKETQTRLLKSALENRGYNVQSISFPRYGQTSAVLVQEYLNGAFGTDPDAINAYGASSFFAMDRFASYLREWGSSYRGSEFFIADRYVTSNAIHQCSKLPRNEWDAFLEWLFDFEHEKLGLPRPDCVFYLHVDIEDSQRLLANRYHGDALMKDIHESDLDYLVRSQEAAEYCCRTLGWERIECIQEGALRPIEAIHDEIAAKVIYGCTQ